MRGQEAALPYPEPTWTAKLQPRQRRQPGRLTIINSSGRLPLPTPHPRTLSPQPSGRPPSRREEGMECRDGLALAIPSFPGLASAREQRRASHTRTRTHTDSHNCLPRGPYPSPPLPMPPTWLLSLRLPYICFHASLASPFTIPFLPRSPHSSPALPSGNARFPPPTPETLCPYGPLTFTHTLSLPSRGVRTGRLPPAVGWRKPGCVGARLGAGSHRIWNIINGMEWKMEYGQLGGPPDSKQKYEDRGRITRAGSLALLLRCCCCL